MTPGEHLWPAVAILAGVQLRHRHGRANGGRYPPESSSISESRDDTAIVAPTHAARRGRVAKRDGGAATRQNFLELAIGEEADPFSVGRKERKGRVLRSGERRHRVLIQQARVQAYLAVGAAQSEGQSAAVG